MADIPAGKRYWYYEDVPGQPGQYQIFMRVGYFSATGAGNVHYNNETGQVFTSANDPGRNFSADLTDIDLYDSGHLMSHTVYHADGSEERYTWFDVLPGQAAKTYGPKNEYSHGNLKTTTVVRIVNGERVPEYHEYNKSGDLIDMVINYVDLLDVKLEASYDPLTNRSLIELTKPDGSIISKSGIIGNVNGLALQNIGARILKEGAAGLVGQDGGTLVGMDGGTLVGNDGASLVGMDGGTLAARSVADKAGTAGLISDNGARATGVNPAGLVGQDGATILASTNGQLLGVRAFTGTAFNPSNADDHLGTTATKGVVNLNSTATSGNIEKNGDRDWFKVTLIANAQYTFEAKGVATGAGTLVDPYLKLYNSNGALVGQDDDSGASLDSKLFFTTGANGAGTYYVEVSEAGDDQKGTYKVSLSGLVGTTGADTFTTISSLTGRKTTNGDDIVHGFGGNDLIQTGSGADKLYGGDNDDLLSGGAGADLLDGGNGTDTVSYAGAAALSSSYFEGGLITVTGVKINLVSGEGFGSDAEGDDLVSIENVAGSDHNDYIHASGTKSGRYIGGSGFDTVSYEFAGLNDGVKLDLSKTAAQVVGHPNDKKSDSFASIENLVGTDIAASKDILTGDAANNILVGLQGDDKLDGASGDDILIGGLGDDVYLVGSLLDDVREVGSLGSAQGIDEVRSTITWTLEANLENLKLGGASAMDGTGNELDNKIIGNAFVNVIKGLDGDDWLIGEAGIDTLEGGNGADVLQGGAGDDVLDGGTDDEVQNNPLLLLLEGDTLSYAGDGGGVALTLGEFTFETEAKGAAIGKDKIKNFEHVIGTTGVDSITGNALSNFIDGRAGKDNLKGEEGDDVFIISGIEGQDDTIDGGGHSTVSGTVIGDSILIKTATVTLTNFNATTSGIENWGVNIPVLDSHPLLGGPVPISHDLLGTSANNTFDFSNILRVDRLNVVDGKEGNDIIKGSTTFVRTPTIARPHDDDFRGGSGADQLFGNVGNDILEGGTGTDTLDGGEGNDILIVASLDATTDTILGGNGTDEVRVIDKDSKGVVLTTGLKALSLADFNSFASIEKWTGNGMGVVGATYKFGNFTYSSNTLDFSGLTAANVTNLGTIDGAAGDDTIRGTQAGDWLVGGTGIDSLEGNGGDDFLNGGAEADFLRGGSGLDTVDYSHMMTAFTLTLSLASGVDFDGIGGDKLRDIEGVIGGSKGDTLTGTHGANYFDGGGGDDTINAGDGNDIIVIKGMEAVGDTVNAGSGGETLGDTLEFGGTGDVYLKNFNTNLYDVEVLNGKGKVLRGFDGATAAVSANVIDLSGFTNVIDRLGRVEGGIGDDTLTGVDLADNANDFRGADSLYGGADKDKIYGLKGNDALRGDAGDDTIEGGEGNDQIDGGTGNDILDGGIGNDIFYTQGLEAKGDTIKGGTGNDLFTVIGPKTTNLALTNFNSQDNTINGVVGSSIERWAGSGQNVVGDGGSNYLNFSKIDLLVPISAPKAMGYIDGMGGDDVIFGTQLDDDIRGGSGLNQLDGQDGNDTITGGASFDNIFGGEGNDTLNGGGLYDYVSGGAGDDTLIITGAEAVFDDLFGDADTDTVKVEGTATACLHNFSTVLYSIEKWSGNGKGVDGTSGNDTLDFSNLSVRDNMGDIRGLGGDDTITGSFARDTIVTGTGNDKVIHTVNSGQDKITDFDVIVTATDTTRDKIDLTSFTDIRNLSDLQTYIDPLLTVSTGANPSLTFTFGASNSLTLEKVKFSQLTAANFIFNTDPPPPPPGPAAVWVSKNVTNTAPYSTVYTQSSLPTISADGKWVTYKSDSFSSPTFASDVFLTNIATGVTSLVSYDDANSNQSTGSVVGTPDISADGRFVLYTSTANATIDPFFPNTPGLFVHDSFLETNKLVSRDGAGSAQQGFFGGASMSGDGRYITYLTFLDMTGTGSDPSFDLDVYRYDQTNGAVLRVTTGISGGSSQTDISDDGNFVAFGGANKIWLKDIQLGTLTEVSSSASAVNLSISPNGQNVLYDTMEQKAAGDTDSARDVYLFNSNTGTHTLISTGTAGDATAGSMSADGNIISFQSADALLPGDTNGIDDLYVLNRTTSTLTRVETGFGQPDSSVSADGSVVAYITGIGSATDTNGKADIYTQQISTPTSQIFGNYLANILSGTAGADVIIGYDGNDKIEGRGGTDFLIGGGGVDHFVYNDVAHSPDSPAGALDTILFEAGIDQIDLRGIDAVVGNGATHDAFIFNGSANEGKLVVQNGGQETIGGVLYTKSLVLGSVNSDNLADFAIKVYASQLLTQSDFILSN